MKVDGKTDETTGKCGREGCDCKCSLKKDILILKGDDWEGLFIDGKLIDEGHELGEGSSTTYLLEKSEEYNFTSKDVRVAHTNEEDSQGLYDNGHFPEELKDLNGSY